MVPAPGAWKVRVWYRDGWAQVPEETVEVAAKKESKPVKIALPAKLNYGLSQSTVPAPAPAAP